MSTSASRQAVSERCRSISLDTPGIEAQLGEVVGLALAVARFLGEPQQLAIRDQREPGIGDFRDQQQLRRGARSPRWRNSPRAPRGAGCARGRTGPARTPSRPRPGGIRARELALARGRQRRRQCAALSAVPAGIDGRHQIGALDAVLRARRFDVQRGDAQVAVVEPARARCRSCSSGSGKNSLPADFRGRHGSRGRAPARCARTWPAPARRAAGSAAPCVQALSDRATARQTTADDDESRGAAHVDTRDTACPPASRPPSWSPASP